MSHERQLTLNGVLPPACDHSRRLRDIVRIAPGMLLLGGYLVTTFVLTHIDLSGTSLSFYSSSPSWFPIDKLYHITAYGGLTLVVLCAFAQLSLRQGGRVALGTRLKLCALVMAYGILDECTQPFVGRNLELFDMLANLVGITCGSLLFAAAESTRLHPRIARLLG